MNSTGRRSAAAAPGCSRPTAHAEHGGHGSRARGAIAEEFAARWLEARGLRILLRNFSRRRGELDLVALDHEVLVIVEVRSRRDRAYGGAAASVVPRKQRRIVHAARQLLQSHPDLARRAVRFDVVALTRSAGAAGGPGPDDWDVEWIRHAFTA